MKNAMNPYLPLYEYIPDGEPHVFGDRIYVTGSHDKERGDTFCMLDYVIWSAPVSDLSNWTNKGVNYRADQDPDYDPVRMPQMYASDLVQGNDGRFYLYYCMAGFKGQGGYSNPVSVAVSDTPDGIYEYLGHVQTPDGKPFMDYVCFDPAVINDNGTIRLYYGDGDPMDEMKTAHPECAMDILSFQAKLWDRDLDEILKKNELPVGAVHVTLADDMLTITSEPSHVLPIHTKGTEFEGHGFFEASSIRKINQKYYFIYSTEKMHELAYAISDYPDHDFHYKGVIISNADLGYNGNDIQKAQAGNDHGSIENVNGQWYVFYHRHTHNTEFSRQGCAEKITILSDGTIPMVEMTSCGLSAGPLTGHQIIPAPYCCNLTDGVMKVLAFDAETRPDQPRITSAETKDGTERLITSIVDHTLIGFKYFVFEDLTQIRLRIRGNGEGTFAITIREPDLHALAFGIYEAADDKGLLGVLKADSYNTWTDLTLPVQITSGVYPLYILYQGTGSFEMLEIEV